MDNPIDAPPDSRTFLVERYWPDIDEARARALAASLEHEARSMAVEGIAVEHVGSILMPRDRVVFSLIAATDEASARQLSARVGAPADRIAVAIRLTEGDPCTER
ncbi:MAG TPA: hypothetical protein VIM39_02910 [Candidatus Limnocylindrales bacterium]|jgi:hypothetical protein